MSRLADRYAWAVVRLLPEAQRPEIERELHELVAEMSDARREASPELTADEVERAVLVELGPPGSLAARYVEQPRALIGHESFPAYLRTLKLVLAIAVPIVVVAAVLGSLLEDDPTVGDVALAAISGAWNAGIQVAFWVTVAYAALERWPNEDPWTPDDLPDLPATGRDGQVGIADAAFGIVLTVLAAVALVWQHVRPVLRDDDGEGVPFLHPDLWSGPGQALLALLAVAIVVQAGVLALRRWTWPLAGANLAINAAMLAIVAWLALDERLLNVGFLEVVADRAGWAQTPAVDPWIPIAIVGGVAIWDSIEAFVSARRSTTGDS